MLLWLFLLTRTLFLFFSFYYKKIFTFAADKWRDIVAKTVTHEIFITVIVFATMFCTIA